MQSGPEVGLFFFVCLVFTLVLFTITRGRVKYFKDIDRTLLATKDPFWSNIHGLTVFILLTIICADFMLVLIESRTIDCMINSAGNGEGNICGPNYFQSMLMGDELVDIEFAMFYLGSLLIPLIWTSWAFLQELKISKALKDARIDLLLGRINQESNSGISNSPSTNSSIQQTSDEPATFEQVLAAMDLELKKAVQAADELKIELDETKQKVVILEEEVQEKDEEISQIKDSKSHFDDMISESSQSNDENGGKNLSLTDSVMVGDSIMGGVKIDKQINNDAEAIAKAVIDAYRKGISDSS